MRVPGSRAIVIGAGVVGLLTARALAASISEVSIVERDRLEDEPSHRFRSVADLRRISRSAQRTAASIAHQAWTVSATQDLRYPVTLGPSLGIRLLHRYMDAMLLAATIDEDIANTFLNVLNVMEGPAALRRPATVLRVLRQARRARQIGPLPQPLLTRAS